MKTNIILIIFFLPISLFGQFSGVVKDDLSQEVLLNAFVTNLTTQKTVKSNNYGYFSINATISDTLLIKKIGFEVRQFILAELPSKYDFYLKKETKVLDEVSIRAKKSEEVFDQFFPSKITLSAAQIQNMPMILGEKDPIKALQFMPGIQEIAEGSSSLSVRGGDVSQNLIIVDDATVYNANHLFGFFSTINADPLKELVAYKGSFPAEYGGRLSSIIDVRLRDGNKQKYTAQGSIGLISSRLMVEGPLKKNESSFLIATRRTYADFLIKPFQPKSEKTGYFFQDLNLKLNFRSTKRTQYYFSFFGSKDLFEQNNKIPRRESFLINDTALGWQNLSGSFRANTNISPRLFRNISLIYSAYSMRFFEQTIQDYRTPPRSENLNFKSSISNISFKSSYDYFVNADLSFKLGIQMDKHNFSPREFGYVSSRTSDSFSDNAIKEQRIEGGLFFSSKYQFKKIIINAGTRMSYFSYPKSVRFEPRFSFNYSLNQANVFSMSYTKMNQYLHLISNTGNGLPTDIWIPSTANLKPATSDMISGGYTYTKKDVFIITFETYYKKIIGSNFYKSGANFLSVGQGANTEAFVWEKSLIQGQSWNYGYELSFQKTKGKLTGMGGYTLAWSISKADEINEGKPFYNRQDRRHILETNWVYQINVRKKLAFNLIFATGNALSLPNAIFFRQDAFRNYSEIFSGINSFRADNYHRLDLSYFLQTKKRKNTWEFSVYNAYFRKNPYNYDTVDIINLSNRTQSVGIKRSWLIPIVPSVSYNFKIESR